MIDIQENTSISRLLTVDIEGKAESVVSLVGQVVPGKAMSFSMSIINKELADANHADIADALDAFVGELRTLAADNGLPT